MHDQFIRAILSDKAMATDYFQQYLPASVSHKLDFTTLVHLPDTYLSEELKKTMSDIVYECRIKNEAATAKVSLLIEHKSAPDKYTPLQVGGYIFSALQKQVANSEELSVVIPVLLYHGKDRWHYQTVAGLFNNPDPEWNQFIPDFDYVYNNLGDIPDATVEALNNRFLAASLLALKHAFENEWLKHNALRVLLLADADAPAHLQKPLIIYLLSKSGMKAAEVKQLFESLSLSSDYKNSIMSTLDYLVEEGIEKGKAMGFKQAEEKKNYEFVGNLLRTGKFTHAEIAKLANVSEVFVIKVKVMLEM